MKTTETEETTEKENNPTTFKVIGCAIEVHRFLGPGLLESTYEQCLAHELHLAGVEFKIQVPIPVNYRGIRLNCGYRADIIVENSLILELKSVEHMSKVHEAQILTYMKLAKIPLALLINVNTIPLKNGIRCFAMSSLCGLSDLGEFY